MYNLFYNLPHELQNIIFRFAVNKNIDERNYCLNNLFDDYYIKTHNVRKQPKWYALVVGMFPKQKYNKELYHMVDDYYFRMNHNVLSMQWMKRDRLIDLCEGNGLTIKKNSSKRNLITILLKVK